MKVWILWFYLLDSPGRLHLWYLVNISHQSRVACKYCWAKTGMLVLAGFGRNTAMSIRANFELVPSTCLFSYRYKSWLGYHSSFG